MRLRAVSIIAISIFAILGLALFLNAQAKTAKVNTYQVTGPVLEVTDTMIAVQKGNDRWELARDSSTKVTGDLKVGAKVTIVYKMIATSIEVKLSPAKTSEKPQSLSAPVALLFDRDSLSNYCGHSNQKHAIGMTRMSHRNETRG